ncbi:TetR family transcriptional regulator [Roseomonas alkaliterrae]|uniref:TetR family transcriptional regulator n=1 Tax=Neoroseomonas alkaliterrae TaxID=1452450 RepID=UPI001BADAD3F|nr:TetR family transcriptional regulator [Neoroseomonas alkaliterrae]
MPRRRKEDAERTRQAVLDAAEVVFFERGVARASLEEIAQAAGVTRGAVYWHFSGKLELFLALDARARLPHEELLARLGEDPGPDPLDALARASEDLLAGFERDPRQRRLLTVLLLRCEYVAEMAPALERQRRAGDALRAQILRFFSMVADQGRLHPRWRPEMAAQVFFALFVGLLFGWLHAPEGTGIAAEGGLAIRAFLASLAADPEDGGKRPSPAGRTAGRAVPARPCQMLGVPCPEPLPDPLVAGNGASPPHRAPGRNSGSRR